MSEGYCHKHPSPAASATRVSVFTVPEASRERCSPRRAGSAWAAPRVLTWPALGACLCPDRLLL